MNDFIKIMLFLLFPALGSGQMVYEGTVVNKVTREKVPFATVGLMKQNAGTNADERGRFSFPSLSAMADTIIVSCVGFETLKIPADKFRQNDFIQLQPKQATLKEVVVTSNYKWTSTVLNEYGNCGSHYYTTSDYINQVAQYFQAPAENCLLSEIEICKYAFGMIDPARTKFRVRIYGIDPVTGAPSTDLCDSIIEVDATGRHVKLRMEKYGITIPGKEFFVAVEWLRIPMNADKNKERSKGKKGTYFTYSPLLAFKTGSTEASGLKNWQLDYRGKWISFHHGSEGRTLMIAATVKY